MLVLFDNDTLQLNVRAGALETYAPDEQVKAVTAKTEELKVKVQAKQTEMAEIYKKFITEEIEPVRVEIRKAVLEINKKNNPNLEQILEAQKPGQ